MAIKLPDPGNGIPEQKTGNDEWTNMQIVRDNFADQSNAASRLVGKQDGQIPLAENIRDVAFSTPSLSAGILNLESDKLGFSVLIDGVIRSELRPQLPIQDSINNRIWVITQYYSSDSYKYQIAYNSRVGGLWSRHYYSANEAWSEWAKHYTSKNTTIEDGTNYIKVASPILRLQHDSFEKEHEAEKLDIKVENPKTGVYKITGTTGLRNDGTWAFSPPKDEHNNVLCMVEVEEDGDIVTVKTYKKKFDFETVSIVPDYDNPTDIPEGATVMLRFNDLPQEQLDEPTI